MNILRLEHFFVAKVRFVDLLSSFTPAQSTEGALARAVHLD